MTAPAATAAPAAGKPAAAAAAPGLETEPPPEFELAKPEVKAVAAAPETPSSPCAGSLHRGLFDGPAAVGFYDADFATGRRACARTEVGISLQGGAIIDEPDFYGSIAGGAVLYGSYALGSTPLEVFGSLELLKVQYVQNASLKALGFSLGPASLGATYALLRTPRLTVAPAVRLMLPTDLSNPNVRTVGLELGGAASFRPFGFLELHGYLGGDLSAGISAGPALAQPGLLASVGLQLSPFSWGGLVLDLNAHAGEVAYLAPSAGLRFALGKGWGLELAGTLPLLGTIRNDAAAGLKVAYRL